MMNPIEAARNFLARRRTAYIKTFLSPYGEEVLRDLAKFCRATDSTYNPDPRIHALLEGRREVWLRISQHLNLSDEELWRRYGTPQPQDTKE